MYKKVFFKLILFSLLLFVFSATFVHSLSPSYLFFFFFYTNTTNVEMLLLITPSEDFSSGSGLTVSFPVNSYGQWCKEDAASLSVSGTVATNINIEGWQIDAPLPGNLQAVCYQGGGNYSNDTIEITGIDSLVGGTSYGVRIDPSSNLSTGLFSGSNNIIVDLKRGLITESAAYAVYLQSADGVTVTAFVDEDFFSRVEVLDPVVEKGIWSRVRVTVLDSQGNPIPGRQVEIDLDVANLNNWEIENPSGTTNSNGIFQTRVRGFVTGTINVSAIDKTFSQDVEIKDFDNLTVIEVPTITLNQLPMYTSGLSREITWSPHSGNYEYFIEASLDASFNTIEKTSGWITSSGFTFHNLQNGQVYYYRGKARNIAEIESGYSNIVSSIQAEKPKGMIEVLDPIVEKGMWSRVRITLVDSNGNPLPGRRIFFQIDRPNLALWDIEQPVGLTNSNGVAEGRIRGFEVATVRVTAQDRTIPLNFTIDAFDWLQVTQLPTLQLHSLPNYSKGLTRRITWNNLVGNYQYNIQISRNADFISPASSGWISFNVFTFKNLDHAQGYFYRGMLRNSAGVESSFSNVVFSIQDDEPPDIEKVDFETFTRNQRNFVRFTFLIKDLSGVSNVKFECKIPNEGVYASCGSISSMNDFHYIVFEESDLFNYEVGNNEYLLEYCVEAEDIVGNIGSLCKEERFYLLKEIEIVEEEPVPVEPLPPFRRNMEEAISYIQDLELDELRFRTGSIALVSTLAPATLLTIALSPATLYPLWQLLLGLFAIFRKKKKILPYGYVYDAISKEPINRAIIRIYKGKKLITTTVTNVYGIFTASLEGGEYFLKVSSPNYSYPSKLITGKVDPPLENIYRGGRFVIKEDSNIQYSIPLDPLDSSHLAYYKTYVLNKLGKMFLFLQKIFISLGFLLALFLYVRDPSTFNLIILIIYLPLIGLHLFLASPTSKRHSFGLVKNRKGELIEGVSLGLRELKFEKLIAKRVTDKRGRYKFLVPGGEYQLELLTPGYEITNLKERDLIFKGSVKKPLLVRKNIVLEKKGDN